MTSSPAPIRVCHVMTADLCAGAEVQVATTASYLVGRRDVELTAVLFNDGWLAGELRRLGVEVAIVDEGRHNGFRIVRAVAAFLASHGVDIVHTHRCKDNVLGAIAARLARVPHLVRTAHGLTEPLRGWARAKYRVYDAADRAALRWRADRIVAVSRHTAAALADAGCARNVLTVLHNGIDLGRVRATRAPEDVRRALGFERDDRLVGSAGRLVPVKDHASLLRAATRILRHEPRARLVIVGTGPLKDELRGLAGELGIASACRIVDPDVSGLSVYDLVASFDVFVLPSLSEGTPMALLEAMALGRPAVASAVGGIPEIINDESGVLVEPANHVALADACLDLLQNPARAAALGARGRDVVEQRFSSDENGRALVDLYRDVAARGRTPQATKTVGLGALAIAPIVSVGLRARQRLVHAMERRRLRRLRRNPVRVAAEIAAARRILVVCHGNIIRSPFAARLMAQALGGRAPVAVASAGLEAVPGRPSHPTAVKTAAPLQVDLGDHTASRLSAETVGRADAIFVMDVPQLLAVRKRFPEAAHKTFLLTSLAADGPLEIRDPIDGDASIFQTCYEHISVAVRPIVSLLAAAAR